MVDLIQAAWSVNADSVFGGPNWLDSDRFDIIAKASPTTTSADLKLMLRALLLDRFKLKLHNEQKTLPAFVLSAGKRSSQLREAAGSGEGQCQQSSVEQGPPIYVVVDCRNMTMAALATQLPMMANAYIDHQVVDATGLKGAFDFQLKWTPRQALVTPAPAGGDAEPIRGLTIFEAVDKLGLKLEAQKRPVPVLVVDSLNRVPTENLPGVGKSIPNAPTEFEVAEIKPSEPGKTQQTGGFLPGGRIDLRNFTFKQLIAVAWDWDESRIAGGPDWLDKTRFDIVAKAPGSGAGNTPPPIDTVRLMLRALLADRFKLKTHNEDQPVAVFTMVVDKRGSKLKEADPASRSGCKPSMGDSGAGPAAVAMINLACVNTTMEQFADTIHRMAGAYLDHPVVDATGLKGGYDFTIKWTPKQQMTSAGRGGDAAAGGLGASDPNGGLTVFEAAEKQLGLKIEGGQKHAMTVIAIDHVEEKPTDN
jgi:uncharacterized protein (TIGR03435 family)